MLDVPAGPEHDAAVARFITEPALTQFAKFHQVSRAVTVGHPRMFSGNSPNQVPDA